MEENIIDLEIKGSGTSKGGKYNNVIIEGNGRIDGDLECINIEVKGQCHVDGDVKAETMKVEGHNSIKGSLEADEVDVQGELKVNEDFTCKKAVTRGMFSVNGNCDADNFKMDGMFRIRGLLNTDQLELNLHGPSDVREIGGEKIIVKRQGKSRFNHLKKMIIPSEFNTGLITDAVEGDEIYLEYTRAKVVRGKDIELGPGCEIDLIEYYNDFKQHEESKVSKYKQL